MTILELNDLSMCKSPDSSWSEVFYLNDEAREVIVLHRDNALAFGFFETKGLPSWPLNADWKQNLKLKHVSFYVGNVRLQGPEGFVNEYRSFRADLIKQVQIYQPKRIYLGGRSQGGAHLTYFLAEVMETFPGVSIVARPFGTMRCLVPWSASYVDRMIFASPSCDFLRINATGDPVPGILPKWAGLADVGHAIWIGSWWRRFWPFDWNRHTYESYTQEIKKFEK